MRKFALYLPQYHEIEENNKWWGKGFTEWTNVKAAKPLFGGHEQPLHPLGEYYDLTDPKTIKTQIEEAKKYGIEGFIYYHYYFSGKLIMEKPVKMFLDNTELEHSYFFCWANHNWLKGDGDHREVLIRQEYGDIDDWEKHFQYLLPYFKDCRYEKKDNRPLFMLYVCSFEEKIEMFDYFNKRCIEEGFNGIYIIETYTGNATNKDLHKFSANTSDHTKMIYFREPNVAMSKFFFKHPLVRLYYKTIKKMKKNTRMVLKIRGSRLIKYMTKKMIYQIDGKTISHGVYFSWDNTPRHGRKGYIIMIMKKEELERYLGRLKNEEYIFINAWNEWAEGMILEPTKEYGYRNLEWLRYLN